MSLSQRRLRTAGMLRRLGAAGGGGGGGADPVLALAGLQVYINPDDADSNLDGFDGTGSAVALGAMVGSVLNPGGGSAYYQAPGAGAGPVLQESGAYRYYDFPDNAQRRLYQPGGVYADEGTMGFNVGAADRWTFIQAVYFLFNTSTVARCSFGMVTLASGAHHDGNNRFRFEKSAEATLATLTYIRGGGNTHNLTGASPGNGRWFVIVARWDGTSPILRINGTQYAPSVGSTGMFGPGPMSIGHTGGDEFQRWMREGSRVGKTIILDAALDDAGIAEIETSLMAHYGL